MTLNIVEAGHPALRTSARPLPIPVDDPMALAALAGAMAETMRAAPGVGLAANQVGLATRLIVIEDRADYHFDVAPEVMAERERVPFGLQVLVNPRLTVLDEEVRDWFEGCLSIPGYTAIVPRWRRVLLNANDLDGRPIESEAVGWRARILQHEVDHLDGRMYVDRMLPQSFMSSRSYVTEWNQLPIAECKARLGIPDGTG